MTSSPAPHAARTSSTAVTLSDSAGTVTSTGALAWALRYRELGFAPIPMRPRSKVPCVAWKDLQDRLPTEGEIRAWWCEYPDAGVALVMGASGCFALDLDGGDVAVELLRARGIELPPGAPRSRTGTGGHHVLLRAGLPRDVIGLVSDPQGRPHTGVDVRGQGLIIVPPSIHPNGQRYEWTQPPVPVDQLPFAPLALAEMIDAALAPPPTAPTAPLVVAVGGASALERARAYMAHVPPAIEGQKGDEATYIAACRLARDFGLTEADALHVFREWNTRCSPPWSDVELAAKLAHAAKYGTGPVGAKLDEPRRPPVPDAPRDHTERGSPAEPPRRIWSLAEAAQIEFAPPRWLIPGYAPGDGFRLVHGDVRVGKSLVEFAAGIALAAGVPAFGALEVPEAVPVVYITEEDNFGRIVERALLICRGYNLPEPPPNFHVIPPSGLSLDDPEAVGWLIAACCARQARQIILDPVRSLTGCADAGPKEFRPFVVTLREIARHTGAVVTLVHHDVKPPAGITDTRRRGHRASGGAVFSIADAPIHVERHGADVHLIPHSFKFADDPDRLVITPTFAADAIRFTAQVDTETPRDEAGELYDLVLSHVLQHPGDSTNAVRKALGRRQDDVARALVELHRREQVVCQTRGKAKRWTATQPSVFVRSDGTHGTHGTDTGGDA